MIHKLAALGLVAIVVAAASGCGSDGSDAEGQPGEKPALTATPQTFRLSLGAYRPENYQIRWSGTQLLYTQTGRRSRTVRFTPSIAQWTRFRKTIDALDIWKWKKQYKPKGSAPTDQLAWSVALKYRDNGVNSHGYMIVPPRFSEFEYAVSKLVGDRPVK